MPTPSENSAIMRVHDALERTLASCWATRVGAEPEAAVRSAYGFSPDQWEDLKANYPGPDPEAAQRFAHALGTTAIWLEHGTDD